MQLRRLVLGIGGLIALAVSLTATVPADAFDSLVTAAGSDYLVVAGVAVVGLLAALGRFHTGRTSKITQATMPDPECPVTVRPLGDEFDEALADIRLHIPFVGRSARQSLHADLRAMAVRTLCRVDHCNQTNALVHLERGDWTTDEHAAAFLRDEKPPTPSLATEFLALLRGEPWFRTQTCRAAEALLTVAETNGGYR